MSDILTTFLFPLFEIKEIMPPLHQTSSQNVQLRPDNISKRVVVGIERVVSAVQCLYCDHSKFIVSS